MFFSGRHPPTCRTKTANITKDDILNIAKHVTVLRRNIIFCDIRCFKSEVSGCRPSKAL